MTVAYVSDGAFNPAKACAAGTPAPLPLNTGDSVMARSSTPGCAEVSVQPGEAMVSISCGGGGYGPPEERAPWRVAEDVREGSLVAWRRVGTAFVLWLRDHARRMNCA